MCLQKFACVISFQSVFVSLLMFLASPHQVSGQVFPNLSNVYVSPLSIFEDSSEKTIDTSFVLRTSSDLAGTFKKRQANLLIYLKLNESKILRAAHSAVQMEKQGADAAFQKLLEEKKLVQLVASAKTDQEAVPEDHLHSGIFSYPFSFKLKISEALKKMLLLEDFDSAKKYSDQPFGLIVFVPLNNSKHADKLKGQKDLDYGTANSRHIIYFYPLPYQLTFWNHVPERGIHIKTDLDFPEHFASGSTVSKMEGAWRLTRSREYPADWVDEREAGIVVFRWRGNQLVMQNGKPMSQRSYSVNRDYRQIVFSDIENSNEKIGETKGIYSFGQDDDSVHIVFLKDEQRRATEFPSLGDDDLKVRYEYVRVKPQGGEVVEPSTSGEVEPQSKATEAFETTAPNAGIHLKSFELTTPPVTSPKELGGRNQVHDADVARADILKGKLVLLGPPLPNPPWWNKYSRLLKAKGITQVVVYRQGVALTDADVQYNQVMRTEIQRRFGAGILSTLLNEAKGQ